LSLDARSRRAVLASLLLVAVALAALAVPFFHTGNETEGDCIACRLTLQAVAIHVPLVATSIALVPVGVVAIAGPTRSSDGDAQPASSRGPPLV
jgi:hypothetical protein